MRIKHQSGRRRSHAGIYEAGIADMEFHKYLLFHTDRALYSDILGHVGAGTAS